MRRARAGVTSPLGDRDGWDRPRERRRYGVGKLRPSCIRSRAHEAPPQRDDVRQEQRDMLWHGSIGIMPRFAREYSSKTIIDPEKRVRDVSSTMSYGGDVFVTFWEKGLAAYDPSLRWLDTQIHKSWGINRIHDVSWRHVSMAGRGRVPHRTLRESSAAGEPQGFAGFRLSGRSPGYFAQ